jgi:hypothetical protein
MTKPKSNIDVSSYKNVFSKEDMKLLYEDVLKLNQHINKNIPFNDQIMFWLDKDAKPKNMIEKYVLNSYKMISKHEGEIKDLAGFEWWVHHTQPDDSGNEYFTGDTIALHIDRDENHYMLTRELVKPKRGTILYLTTIDDAPTIITDLKSNYGDTNPKNIDKELNNMAFSFPEIGKITTFDGQYMHGAMEELSPKSERMTIMVNYWHYKLDEGKEQEIFSMLDKFDCEEDKDLWYPPKVDCQYESDTSLLELTNEETKHYPEQSLSLVLELVNNSEKFKGVLWLDKNNKYKFEIVQPKQRPEEVIPTVECNIKLEEMSVENG